MEIGRVGGSERIYNTYVPLVRAVEPVVHLAETRRLIRDDDRDVLLWEKMRQYEQAGRRARMLQNIRNILEI